MRGYRVLIAAAMVMATVSGPSAAPDNTRGVAIMSAVVSSGGELIRGSGAVSVQKDITAFYRVYFNRPVYECTGVAGTGNIPQFTYDGGQAAVNFSEAPEFVNSVVVKTRNATGAIADWPFHLIVFCSK